jgi:hypothetical protein
MSPVRKENPASHLLVFLRNILNLNFNLDMSCAIQPPIYANIMLKSVNVSHVTFYLIK